MKTILLVATFLLLVSCQDSGTNNDPRLDIRFSLVEGRVWADFRNITLPEDDNVRCEFTVVVRNGSQTMTLEEGQISEVEVYRAGTMERIGTVQLYTAWDGHVGAGEEDTVHLIKRTNQGPTLSPIPCDSSIAYKIVLVQHELPLGTIQRNSVLFECYQWRRGPTRKQTAPDAATPGAEQAAPQG
jgi:hypothetical protein